MVKRWSLSQALWVQFALFRAQLKCQQKQMMSGWWTLSIFVQNHHCAVCFVRISQQQCQLKSDLQHCCTKQCSVVLCSTRSVKQSMMNVCHLSLMMCLNQWIAALKVWTFQMSQERWFVTNGHQCCWPNHGFSHNGWLTLFFDNVTVCVNETTYDWCFSCILSLFSVKFGLIECLLNDVLSAHERWPFCWPSHDDSSTQTRHFVCPITDCHAKQHIAAPANSTKLWLVDSNTLQTLATCLETLLVSPFFQQTAQLTPATFLFLRWFLPWPRSFFTHYFVCLIHLSNFTPLVISFILIFWDVLFTPYPSHLQGFKVEGRILLS